MLKSPWVWLAPAALLGVALLRLPYDYYIVLRTVVCGVSAALVWSLFRRNGRVTLLAAAFAGVAVLYNPLLAFHLGRPTWRLMNLLTIGVFLVATVIGLRALWRSGLRATVIAFGLAAACAPFAAGAFLLVERTFGYSTI